MAGHARSDRPAKTHGAGFNSWFLFFGLLAAPLLYVFPAAAGPTDEFTQLKTAIESSKTWNMPRLEREALRRDALIFPGDRTPAHVAWRRTRALLAHLTAMPNAPELKAEAAALNALKTKVARLDAGSPERDQRAIFKKVAAMRRRIVFKNPLLDFDRIIFLKHNKQARGERHMIDQYLGFNQEGNGGVYVLERPFSERPAVTSLLKNSPVMQGRLKGKYLENAGAFISLDLDYDAREIAFAFTEARHELPPDATWEGQYWTREEALKLPNYLYHHFRPDSTFHVFKANADGTNLRQLTDGKWNDFDPFFMPGGRIGFITERAGGHERCGSRPLPSAALFSMTRDGGDMIQLSWHETNEWHPSVDHNGMIVYTRWDYVDRDSDIAHHIWHCYPDGRDPRSAHGNYPEKRELRPWMEMSIRAIPNSQKYVAVSTPHHGQAYGSLLTIDLRGRDDRASAQLRRVTPEVPFAESESAPGVPHPKGKHNPPSEVYGTPWPLSEDFYLCVHDPGQANYGIYLVDSFGNRELIYRDPRIACLDPIPLRPRSRPPVIPNATLQAAADRPASGIVPTTATVSIMNVYASELPWPAGTKITSIRVVNLFPKDNIWIDGPRIGKAAQALARGVLGTAPVEADGSACFVVPAGAPLYFQALDEKGTAVQTMRSDTYLHPGEQLSCVGCHESKHERPQLGGASQPLALRRPPSVLAPEVPGSYPLTFARLVQPVIQARCIGCHDGKTKHAPPMRGDKLLADNWTEAFNTLQKHAWGMSGGNGTALKESQYSIPGQVGARASKLYAMLTAGHHDVKLSAEELRRLTLWLDCNSNFFGAYHNEVEQARGELVPPKTGIPVWTPIERLVR